MFQKRFVVKVMAAAFLLAALVFTAWGAAHADPNDTGVTQSDNPNLYTALKAAQSGLDPNYDGVITQGELAGINGYLALDSANITSISGLEYCTGITGLSVFNNQIEDISCLSGLTNLTELHIAYNHISDISALSTLTNLTYFDAQWNQISDLTPLSVLTNLKQLYLDGNQFYNLQPLPNLTALTDLGLSNNANCINLNTAAGTLHDLIASLTSIQDLRMGSDNISDLSDLVDAFSYMTYLQTLDLSGNSISDISALMGLADLQSLSVGSNNITDISCLKTRTDLTMLNLSNNPIKNWDPLTYMTNLTCLYLGGSNISDISFVSNLTSLSTFGIWDSHITTLSALSGMSGLQSLIVQNTQVSNISALSGKQFLTVLFLKNNRISDISALSNIASNLVNVHLSRNYLNLTPGSGAMTVINKMTNASYKVYEPQNSLITTPVLAPSASSGYTPYDGNKLKITANVTYLPYWPANVYAAIYTSSGKWVANTSVQKNQTSGTKTFYWDGKVAGGNGLGLPAGQFLNKNGSTTACKVRIVAVQSTNTSNSWTSGFLSFKVYPMPVIKSLTLVPSSVTGFAVGYPNMLKISASVTVSVPSKVVAVIYDRNGKYVAMTSALTNQSSGVKTVYWDGKVSSGNQIGLPMGSYAPNSSTGVLYKVKLAATNASMGVNAQYSSPTDINLCSKVTISGVTVSPTAFTAGASSGNTVKIGYKLSRMSNVSVWVYNSSYNIIYAKLNYSYVGSGAERYAYWDGKATAGNTAGLQAGDLVPAGSYKVKIFAAGTSSAPSTAITVNRIVTSVSNATQLFKAIKSNAIIKLLPGTYNLKDITKITQTSNVYYDYGAIIKGIRNLKIYSDSGVTLTSPERIDEVLTFINCNGITLQKITFGHVVSLGDICVEGVIRLTGCKNITINSCVMYGCGSIGMDISGSQGVSVNSSTIRTCSQNALYMENSGNIQFNKVDFHGIGTEYESDFSVIYNCQSIKLNQCSIYSNGDNIDSNATCYLFNMSGSSRQLTVQGCSFSNNLYDKVSSQTIISDSPIILD